MNRSTTVVTTRPTALTRARRIVRSGVAAALLVPAAVGVHGAISTDAAQPAPHDAALVQGPLVNGPLLDLGGLLNDLRIGQFQ